MFGQPATVCATLAELVDEGLVLPYRVAQYGEQVWNGFERLGQLGTGAIVTPLLALNELEVEVEMGGKAEDDKLVLEGVVTIPPDKSVERCGGGTRPDA